MEYEEITKIVDYIYGLDKSFRNILILAGGLVPYYAFHHVSSRKHGDIDFICNISDINKIREVLKKNGLYVEEFDSLYSFSSDFGFECVIKNIKVGIFPFEIKDKIYQYSFDSRIKLKKIHTINISKKEYIKKYSHLLFQTMSVEVILKSKIFACREIDKVDIDTICKNNYNRLLYSKLIIETDF